MFTRQELPDQLATLVRAQGGVVTAQQLAMGGLSRGPARRMGASWARIAKDMYCAGEPTWMSAAWAGIVRGRDGVLGGEAAAFLHGLVQRSPDAISVFIPERMTRAPLLVGQWHVVFRRSERRGRGEPPKTSVEDTVLDLATEVGEDGLVAALAEALKERKTTPGRMLVALRGRSRVSQRGLIEDMCSAAMGGIESALEWRFQKMVEDGHQLPRRQRQQWLTGSTRCVGWYQEFGVVIELDGRAHDRVKDMWRDNVHALRHGVTTLRFGWWDVTNRPCEVARLIARALRQRGWGGDFSACRRCRSFSDGLW